MHIVAEKRFGVIFVIKRYYRCTGLPGANVRQLLSGAKTAHKIVEKRFGIIFVIKRYYRCTGLPGANVRQLLSCANVRQSHPLLFTALN
jgi:hypothetical protein